MYVCVYFVCVCVCLYVRKSVYMCACVYVCFCMFICVSVYCVCMYVFLRVRIGVYMCRGQRTTSQSVLVFHFVESRTLLCSAIAQPTSD